MDFSDFHSGLVRLTQMSIDAEDYKWKLNFQQQQQQQTSFIVGKREKNLSCNWMLLYHFFTPHNIAQHLFFESESESMMEVKTISELSSEGENEIMKF